MIPGSYSEYNYFAGPNGLPANIQKVLLVGDIAEGGTLAVAKPTAVYNESEVLALVGAGSVLHQMYRAAKNAWKYAQITLVRHKATAGTPPPGPSRFPIRPTRMPRRLADLSESSITARRSMWA